MRTQRHMVRQKVARYNLTDLRGHIQLPKKGLFDNQKVSRALISANGH